MAVKTNKTDPNRGFDAVAESRRWKEAVAAKTEGMSMEERMAWFRSQSSVESIRSRADVTESLVLREESPEHGGDKRY